MKPRHTFRASAIEALEDRQLLSHIGALDLLPHRPAHHGGHAHVRAHAHRIRAAVMPTTADAGGANPGAGATAPTDAQATGDRPPVTSEAVARGVSQSQAAAWSDRRFASAPVKVASASTSPGGPRYADPVPPRTVVMTPADPAASASTNPAGTATPTTPATAAAWVPRTASADAAFAPDHGPATHPAFSFLNGRTLSPADVAALKTAADDFAANDTGGQDKARDAAAVTAFQAGLHDLALGLWSDSHVATADATGRLKTATDAFAQAYTSGAKPAADRAAWKDYLAAVDTFQRSLTDPAAGKTDPAVHAGPAAFRFMPMAGLGRPVRPDAMPADAAFTHDEAVKLGAAVDAFAASYTSGADKARDADAEKTLQTSLAGLMDAHRRNDADPASAPGDAGSWKLAQAGGPGGPQHRMLPMNTPSATTPTPAPGGKA